MSTSDTGPHSEALMPDDAEQKINEALEALRRGAPEAMNRLLPLVYRELKQ